VTAKVLDDAGKKIVNNFLKWKQPMTVEMVAKLKERAEATQRLAARGRGRGQSSGTALTRGQSSGTALARGNPANDGQLEAGQTGGGTSGKKRSHGGRGK
jgi:hypothetical protein